MIDNIYRLTVPGFFALAGIIAGYIIGQIEAATRNRNNNATKRKDKDHHVRILS